MKNTTSSQSNDYNEKESFTGTINLLKAEASKQGIIIADDAIAANLHITRAELDEYYMTDHVPEALFSLLHNTYGELLGARRVYRISFMVEHPDPLDEEENNNNTLT